ncbi:hypothetical protein L7F22_065516 [Adiantum nelumboides]|nr:hypothetical protein [Adiantum nelumboides]
MERRGCLTVGGQDSNRCPSRLETSSAAADGASQSRSDSLPPAPPSAAAPGKHSGKSPPLECQCTSMKAQKSNHSKHGAPVANQLWVDGLLCAYEFIPGPKNNVKVGGKLDRRGGFFEGSLDAELTLKSSEHALLPESAMHQPTSKPPDDDKIVQHSPHSSFFGQEPDKENVHSELNTNLPPPVGPTLEGSHWKPIGWARLGELVQSVQIDAQWGSSEQLYVSDEYGVTAADLAAPYWEPKAGPTWWCNVLAGHPYVESWLANSQKWLHPAVSEALRDESKLISERMKHLYYEVCMTYFGKFYLFARLEISTL